MPTIPYENLTPTAPSLAAAAAAVAAPPPPPAAPFKNGIIVQEFDIALLVILAIFFIAFLPRAVVRYMSPADKGKGYVLQTGGDSSTLPDMRLELERSNTQHSSDSRTLHDHHPSFYAGIEKKVLTPPKHIPSWQSLSYPVSSLFFKTLVPGVTVGHIVVLLVYIGGLLFVGFYFGDPVTNPNRWGFIAASQIPFVYVLSTKNNIIGFLLGLGYEKLNLLHRWVGYIIWFAAHVHGFSHIWQFVFKGTLAKEIKEPLVQWGIVTLCAFDLLVLFSLPVFRRRAYNFFLVTHIIGLILVPIAMSYHQLPIVRYAIYATVFYGIDHLTRLVKTRFATATIQPIPELGMTYVSIPQITHGWRAGQHVRLRVLSSEMGKVGWVEAHPFTIASAGSSASGGGLILMCKKAGGWTEKLYTASIKPPTVSESADRKRKLLVLVEGPYGGLVHIVISGYSAAVIVCGGSGISFGLSTSEELLQQIRESASRTKFIDLVWVIQDQASAAAFIPIFNHLMLQSEALSGVVFTVKIYFTRMLDPVPEESYKSMHSAVEVTPGRPPITAMIDSSVNRAAALQNPSGVAVLVCGPVGLVESVSQATWSIDGYRRYAVGGVELHEEGFGY